jgi:hypothetical protein
MLIEVKAIENNELPISNSVKGWQVMNTLTRLSKLANLCSNGKDMLSSTSCG